MIKKISEWIKRLFTKETLKLPENTKIEEIDNSAIQSMQFRDSVRVEASAEEKI